MTEVVDLINNVPRSIDPFNRMARAVWLRRRLSEIGYVKAAKVADALICDNRERRCIDRVADQTLLSEILSSQRYLCKSLLSG